MAFSPSQVQDGPETFISIPSFADQKSGEGVLGGRGTYLAPTLASLRAHEFRHASLDLWKEQDSHQNNVH